jgi:hypothetical protein
MARRRIGQEQLGFASEAAGRTGSLDELARRIDRTEIDRLLAGIYGTEKGEQGWPPLALLGPCCICYSVSNAERSASIMLSLTCRMSYRRTVYGRALAHGGELNACHISLC